MSCLCAMNTSDLYSLRVARATTGARQLDCGSPDRPASVQLAREQDYQPRVSSSSLGSSVEVEMPTIGSPRPAETRARISASA